MNFLKKCIIVLIIAHGFDSRPALCAAAEADPLENVAFTNQSLGEEVGRCWIILTQEHSHLRDALINSQDPLNPQHVHSFILQNLGEERPGWSPNERQAIAFTVMCHFARQHNNDHALAGAYQAIEVSESRIVRNFLEHQ
jgi:hypothetical protein